MSSLLIFSILITLGIGVAGITSVSNHGTAASTPVITSIIGFVGIAANQFLGMLKIEIARRAAQRETHEIKQALGDVKDGVNLVKKRATKARDVALETKEELGQSLEDIKEKVNSNLGTAVDKAVEAERSQILDHVALPKTNEELQAFVEGILTKSQANVEEVVTKICKELLNKNK